MVLWQHQKSIIICGLQVLVLLVIFRGFAVCARMNKIIVIMRNNVWKETFTFKYREDGALTEYSESTSQIVGKSYYKKTTFYKLDSSGNWIEKYTLDSEGRIFDLEQRKIVYY